MKNIYRIGFLLLFLAIAIYMIVSCYGTSLGGGNCKNILELMYPTENNGYMNPFYALCTFIPVIILVLSFFWKVSFSKLQRAFLILLTITAACTGVLNLMIGLCISCDIKIHYLILIAWNFASFMWLLFLTILPGWTGVNWPFDKKVN